MEDFATVGVALTLRKKNGICEDVRLGLSSAAPAVVRAKRAEEALRGRPITDATLREMGEIAATEVDPMDDNRGSAEYKREMVKVLFGAPLKRHSAVQVDIDLVMVQKFSP